MLALFNSKPQILVDEEAHNSNRILNYQALRSNSKYNVVLIFKLMELYIILNNNKMKELVLTLQNLLKK